MKRILHPLSLLALACLLASVTQAQTRSITNALVLHLGFDDNLNDDSGRGNNASYVGNAGTSVQLNNPTFVPGKLGKGFRFNTYPDASLIEYATLGYPDDLKFGETTDFSIALWINTANSNIFGGDCAYIANRDWNSSSSLGWGIFMQAGLPTVRVHLTTTATGTKKLSVRPVPPGGESLYDGGWHHLAVTCVRGGNVKTYVDGVLEATSAYPSSVNTFDTDTLGESINIGQDGTGTYTQGPGGNPPAVPGTAGFTNAIIDDVGIWRRALSDVEVANIVGFAQLGTNLFHVPDVHTPILLSFTPNNGSAGVLPNIPTSALIQDQDTHVDPSTIQLLVDGSVVPAVVRTVGNSNIVTYTAPFLHAPLSLHTNKLIFADNGTPATRSTNTSVYTIAPWTNLYLGTPLYVENFDELTAATNPPAVYPTGWSVQDCTDPTGNAGTWSLFDATSDAYQDWQVTPIDAVANNFNYGARVLIVNGAVVVNGSLVSVLGSNNIAFAASDQRNGNQVDYLFTGDYNLAGQSNIWLSYNSMYSQENYQLGAVEYSIDQGNSWLPVVYMLSSNPNTIVLGTNGVVDAAATMNNVDLHIPYGTCNYGNSCGSFIGVTPDKYDTLTPYIRLCAPGDHTTWHRVEQFRLPQADGQTTVRFRFAFVGANFWDWGFDNFGLYSLSSAQPALKITNVSLNSGKMTIQWNGNGANFSGLQQAMSLTSSVWLDVPGTIGQTNYTFSVSGAPAFFRARQF